MDERTPAQDPRATAPRTEGREGAVQGATSDAAELAEVLAALRARRATERLRPVDREWLDERIARLESELASLGHVSRPPRHH